MNRVNSKSFAWATETITPLQLRVLEALGDNMLTVEEVAEAATIAKWGSTLPDYRHQPRRRHYYIVRWDLITARSVLGWLATKGLVRLEGGLWRRTQSPSVGRPNVADGPVRARSRSAQRRVD